MNVSGKRKEEHSLGQGMAYKGRGRGRMGKVGQWEGPPSQPSSQGKGRMGIGQLNAMGQMQGMGAICGNTVNKGTVSCKLISSLARRGGCRQVW